MGDVAANGYHGGGDGRPKLIIVGRKVWRKASPTDRRRGYECSVERQHDHQDTGENDEPVDGEASRLETKMAMEKVR